MKYLRMIVALSYFGVSASAYAQPGFISATSIDSVVANSDYVLVGTVEKFEKADPEGEFDASYLRVWLTIEENLKSPKIEAVSGPVSSYPYKRFFHPGGQFEYYGESLAEAKQQGSRLLIAVGGDVPYALKLDEQGLKILSADFQVLSDSDSIIRAAKEAISRVPANVNRLQTLTLWKPDSVELKFGQPLQLNVPVDERLDRKTQGLLESNSFRDRIGGLEAIRYFKTQENIANARELLSDPFKQKLWDTRLRPYNSYCVRKAAWETFHAWGIKVDKPVLREEVEIKTDRE